MQLNAARDYKPDGTPGTIVAGDHSWFTIEQPWNNNKKDKSCVPEADYHLVPYVSPKHGKTWCLHNLSVGVAAFPTGAFPEGHPNKQYEAPNDGRKYRSLCELHSANWASQLLGCMALGKGGQPMIDPKTGVVEPAVENSVNAIEELHALLGEMTWGHILTIAAKVPPSSAAGYVFA